MISVVVCEDIRREESGRLSLMGVYGPSIEVGAVPMVLPSLGVVISLLNPKQRSAVSLRIRAPSGREVVHFDASAPDPYPPQPFVSSFQFKVFPFRIDEVGTYEMRFEFGGEGPPIEPYVHRLNVRLAST